MPNENERLFLFWRERFKPSEMLLSLACSSTDFKKLVYRQKYPGTAAH